MKPVAMPIRRRHSFSSLDETAKKAMEGKLERRDNDGGDTRRGIAGAKRSRSPEDDEHTQATMQSFPAAKMIALSGDTIDYSESETSLCLPAGNALS